MKLTSLEGRLAILVCLATLATAAVTAGMGVWSGDWRVAVTSGMVVAVILALAAARSWARPIVSRIRALSTTVAGLADGDFAVSVARGGGDELDELIESYNEVGEVLRRERQDLYQRELLLDTVIQATPVAMLLIDPRDKVIYSNSAARKLLSEGQRIEGQAWRDVIAHQSPDARAALSAMSDGLFAVENEESGERQIFLLSHKEFRLNARPHRLMLIQHLTRELNRQEVATWKKVIRVISHELNNSVAPISSLIHSSRVLARRGERRKLDQALDAVADRARHLAGFIDRYAEFARLPEPRLESVDWHELFDTLTDACDFRLREPLPERAGLFDRAQLEQAVINLVKNAREAGSSADDIVIQCRDAGNGFWLEIADRGKGMSPTTLSQALVPFYSTKREGGGIGLSLVREIAEAHDGHLSIANRSGGGVSVRLFLPNLRAQADREDASAVAYPGRP